MSGITWGSNTVHTIGGAPAPAAFGAPAPSAFGAPAPAPATGGFGFGAAAPSPAKSSFFGAPAPAPGGFGSYGQQQQQHTPQVPQHHIPAQAAMQASVDYSHERM